MVGVAGGSGSGKTYFAKALARRLGRDRCAILYQDSFYFDQSKKFDRDGGVVNFDHPESIDFALMTEKLGQLKQGQAVEIPVYDFVTHTRKPETESVLPKPVIIVDGILIFHDERLRQLLDERLYFDTPEELRFKRRLERDVRVRGRTPEGVSAQFYKQVKPMHDQFVEPSKAHASVVICDVGEVGGFLASYLQRLRH